MNAPAMHLISTLKAKWIVAECAATPTASQSGSGSRDGESSIDDQEEAKTQLTLEEVEAFERKFECLMCRFGLDLPVRLVLHKLCSSKLDKEEIRLVSAAFEAAGREAPTREGASWYG